MGEDSFNTPDWLFFALVSVHKINNAPPLVSTQRKCTKAGSLSETLA